MYVDTLNPKHVIGTAINAMLEGLDPYTVYYPENDVKELKMMLTGKYAGIGSLIRYHKKLHRVVIDEPYEGMPAAEAGLKKGDIITKLEKEEISSVAELRYELYKHNPGDKVTVTYNRNGKELTSEVTLEESK